ncbi:hypothetical protein [Chiayiivirga flava]|uniref:Uncharacterized protein n=1 Tax=Chiayiivirga flava TaxID=659595 RepID=A0A7W8FZ64_9GAMM|nr:hypothetical protein [Chiayiivirga flava]MBB5206859.1 hypothetical protein [Chiayiivirga flava]
MNLKNLFVALACFLLGPIDAFAYQIAPMGSSFEARLTNETDSNLAKIAGRVGVLLKSPVHEEITQLGSGCPVEPAELAKDRLCGDVDAPFAGTFIIYGVRWNDLPPFRLSEREGRCSAFGKACRTSETVRFSTQPACWYCLFKDAEKTAASRRIAGCRATDGALRGNLMTRSHFGDLQFLHGMASEEGMSAGVTQRKVEEWLQFAWMVASREIPPERRLKEIDIPTIQEHFSCTEWTVADLYILGRQDRKSGLLDKIHDIAFGSVLHTVQDSFAAGHASREDAGVRPMCGETGFRAPPAIREFHVYGSQDGALHDAKDSRNALVDGRATDDWPGAVEATRNLFALYEDRRTWGEAREYVRCLLRLTPDATRSSPGSSFRKGPL